MLHKILYIVIGKLLRNILFLLYTCYIFSLECAKLNRYLVRYGLTNRDSGEMTDYVHSGDKTNTFESVRQRAYDYVFEIRHNTFDM